MDSDNRQIQTAVRGDAESDEPLICPTDPAELDVFRDEYRIESFWCGVLLGGCGGQLTTKRYRDRVCHFSHLPDPEGLLPECGRRARGVSSADHLYVKSATQAWLHRQGHTPRYRFIDRDDAPVGSVVDIDLDGHRLRIHMNASVPPDWDSEDAGELILGPGVPIDPLRLVRRRYVNRVKFESDGSRRVLRFGTQTPHEGTTWGFETSDCEITPRWPAENPRGRTSLGQRGPAPGSRIQTR
ncbi:hypothetical protein OG949_41095 (plasmid) [Streptomyces scopuliridis]|uniref:hypothetical protein n=1 Tax=Streptomyces scopuliridis TaxID=452529 RepID=UPI002DD9DEB0|nr:hypothetical protein [Streptomyces scopuliridis]WSB39139.1 hypothetical protein OG949_41095 [Streptomyces scopuliridis]